MINAVQNMARDMVLDKIAAINFNIALAIVITAACCAVPALADAPNSLSNQAMQAQLQDSTSATGASVSGGSIRSLTTLALSAGNEFHQTVSRRQNKIHSFSNGIGTSKVFFGEAGDIQMQKRVDKILETVGKQFGLSGDDGGSTPQVWTTDFSRQGSVGSDNGFNNYNYNLNGFSGGVDVHAGMNWNFGIAAGYTKVTSAFEALSSTATAVDAYQAALYSTYEHALGTIDSNVSFNSFTNHSDRLVTGDTSNSMANAKGKGYQVAWTLSAMGHGTMDKFTVTPLSGFTFTSLHRGAMKENGAGLYNLNSAATNSASFKPMLGIDIARSYSYRSNTTITPEIYGIYRYEMLDAKETATNSFDSFDTTTASTSSSNLSRHSMQIGSSVAMKIGDKFTTKLQFDSDLQPSSHSYSGMFKLNYSW